MNTDVTSPDSSDPVTLTPQDLKNVKNGTISAVTGGPQYPDIHAAIKAYVREALNEAGVITTANFQAQIRGPLDQYFRDRGYEADESAMAHPPPKP